MITYKLFRVKNGDLYPLYVQANRKMPIGEWLYAECGEKVDDTHVKASGCGGSLSLRPGWHSTLIPFTDWIGKRQEDGTLAQRSDTVWCECEVEGEEIIVTNRYGLREVPNGYYYFRTNSRQKDPWIISNKLKINKVLTQEEVNKVCRMNGVEPQKMAS